MRRQLERWAAVVLASASLAAAVAMVAGRFRRGEVYPAGSAFSTAPEGAAALARALDAMGGIDVVRALDRRDAAGCAAGCTLLYLAASPHGIAGSELHRIEGHLLAGARVVLAFDPVDEDASRCGLCPDAAAEREDGAAEQEQDSATPEPEPAREAALPGWWRKLRFGLDLPRSGGAVRIARRAHGAPEGLPERVTWRSRLLLEALPGSAVSLYRVGSGTVAAEIPVGRGRLALVTDGSLLGNLALRERRETGLLSALLGAPRRAVFEETHLGVRERGGIVALARDYGLGAAGLALVALALLYVWRSLAPLGPRAPQEERVVEDGRDAYSGLVALLERGLGRKRLLSACVEAYRGTGSERLSEAVWQELERTARETEDPAAGYERMRKTIVERRG